MELQPGSTLGPFTVRRLLGRGAMGSVYAVEEAGDPRRLAAKVLHAQSSTSQERFRREGELVARLDHPGIVRVHSMGQLPGGAPYLVFDLVEGETLKQVLRRGPLPQERALAIGREVAAALGHAHAGGVVHRDVKPSNVLIDAEGHARLIDFGIAFASDHDRLTQTGQFTGTLGYLATEQLRRGGAITPRTDVYALGVLLYELLSGVNPFEAEGSVGVLQRIASHVPPPLRSQRPELSPDLERVVARCLEKEPEARFADGGALAAALAAVGEGGASPSSAGTRKLAALGVGALLLGALALAVAAPRGAGSGPTPSAAASASATRAPSPTATPGVRQVTLFGVSPGDVCECELAWEQNRIKIAYSLRWEVESLRADELRIKATILDASFRTAGGRARPRATPSPGATPATPRPARKGPGERVRGLVLHFSIEPDSGRVREVEGVIAVREAWLEGNHNPASREFIGGLVSPRFLTFTGNALFHVLPSQPGETRWTRSLHLQDGTVTTRSFALTEGDLAGDAKVSLRLLDSAQAEGEGMDGQLEWRGGRLQAARVRELTTGGKVYRWEVTRPWRRAGE